MRDYTESILIRITPEQRKLIEKKMKLTGIINMSAYIRKMAIDGYVFIIDFSLLREALRLTSINSNNLNQYVKKANETGSIYLEDINEIKSQQEEIRKILINIYEALLKID